MRACNRLSPTLLALVLFLAACGGPGVGGDPDFSNGPLPEGSIIELILGGTPYPSGNPNVQIGMGPFNYPAESLAIGIYVYNTTFGGCGLSMIIAGNIQIGAHCWTARPPSAGPLQPPRKPQCTCKHKPHRWRWTHDDPVSPQHATLELSQDFDTLQHALQVFFCDLGHFEGYLKEQQRTWMTPTSSVASSPSINVRAHVRLTSEAFDGFVRVELPGGRRDNWHPCYLNEGGFSTSPFEDFWVQPVGGDHA